MTRRQRLGRYLRLAGTATLAYVLTYVLSRFFFRWWYR